MIAIRHSSETKKNAALKNKIPKTDVSNSAWTADIEADGAVILIGGASLAHFRIRVAQSQVRSDLFPSFWSMAGIMLDNKSFLSVPLDYSGDISQVPPSNGVQECPLADYDDPQRFPNIAVIQFARDAAALSGHANQIMSQRSILDLPSLMVPWLGFVWGVAEYGNPLPQGKGLPSAAFVQTVYGLLGIELTPGLSSSSSCPEAIWQSAKWWHGFYEQATPAGENVETAALVPTGSYLIRQPAAAVVEDVGAATPRKAPARKEVRGKKST